MAKKYPGVRHLGGRKYELRIEVTEPRTSRRRGTLRHVEAGSDREAWLIRERLRSELQRAVEIKRPERERLERSLRHWLSKKEIAPSTRSTYSTAVDHWCTVCGDWWADVITPDDVESVLKGWRRAELSVDAVNGRLRVLRTYARDTRQGGMVDGVHAIKRTVRETENDEDNGRGFTLDEFHRWLAALDRLEFKGARVTIWRPLLRLIALTGMRFGEASAIEWPDIDLRTGTLKIRRAQWRGQVGHPKAKASKREIPIPFDVHADLHMMHREAQYRFETLAPKGIVFPSGLSESGHVNNTGLRKNMLKVCKEASIDLDGRPAIHCLRHTFNNIVRKETTELVRQAMLGHADDKMNATYSRVDLEEMRRVSNRIVELVKAGKPSG